MTRSSIAIAVLAGVLIATTAVESHRVRSLQEHSGQLALRNDSAAAAVDATHELTIESPKFSNLLGDSLHLAQRRIVQEKQRGDSVDRLLGLERRGKYALYATVDSLHRVVESKTATTEDSATRIRRADFNVRQEPYTVTAKVELPAPPDTGRLDLRIAMDQIPVVARLSCAPPNADGIRAASLETSSPAWASIKLTDLQQSPDLCKSPALNLGPRAGWHPAIIGGVGLIASSTHKATLGGFAGVGLSYSR